MKYSFHPYHAYYKSRAIEEISSLNKLYPYATIGHFGSTAVTGLGGKGIIDISLSVPPANFKETVESLIATEYDHRPSGGVPDKRHFFQKTVKYSNGHKQLFHLHLTRTGDKNMAECLAFRDFLRTRPDLVIEYSNIKQHAVLAAKKLHKKSDKKKVYRDTKWPVMQKILTLMDGKEHLS